MTDHTPQPDHGAVPDGAVPLTDDVKAGPARDGTASVWIQYTGAQDWYTLTGSLAPLPPEGLAALHELVVEAVKAGAGAEVPDVTS
ncbi:hypothetical protein ACFYYB_28075 [Streptomyces sp. NPDC002886]|uniref:hypothetical protein n=1 Tax=Streptomyces sp. NPDC002886 TaxID=3364667 RepID=UPI0036ADB7B2